MTEQVATDPGGRAPHRGLGGRRRALWRAFIGVAAAVLVITTAIVGSRWKRVRQTQTCLGCHSPESIHLTEHSHPRLDCVACHDPRPVRVLAQSALSLLPGQRKVAGHAPDERRRCRQCHASVVQGLRAITETRGHRVHVGGKPQLDCSACHRGGVHVTKTDHLACARCHSKLAVLHPESSRIPCTSCHDFLAMTTGPNREPSTDCRRCHAEHPGTGRTGQVTLAAAAIGVDRVHGNVPECGLCHNPHRAGVAQQAAARNCARCHAKVVRLQATERDQAHPSCSTCHLPHDRRQVLEQEICLRCHQQSLPGKDGKGRPMLANRHARCASCHVPHRLRTGTVPCADCHASQRDRLAALPNQGHADCQTCHSPHRDVSPAAGCTSCHAGHQDRAHPNCTACHDPHAGKAGVRACSSCHRGAELLPLADSEPHGGTCTKCHATHQVAGASQRCGQCHAKQAKSVLTASGARHRNCNSCHAPHRFGAAPTLCLSCHQQVGGTAHGTDCQRCHSSHGKATAEATTCASCHRDVPQIRGAHQRCTSCHSAHKPASAARCDRCHAPQVAGVRAWPQAEHQRCSTCHLPHQPASPKPCAACHRREQAQFASSRHRSCTSCHPPHRPPTVWWTQCSRCHPAQAASAQAAPGPKHAQCKNCHQPHRGLDTTCRSCHEKLPGAHATRGHHRCADCHGQHRTDVPTRGHCLRCHPQQVDHHPTAPRCSVCHLFQ